VVTADHECGGYHLLSDTAAGVTPDGEFREDWGDHTNVDVPVFAAGPDVAVLDGARVDNLWVNAVLRAAVDGAPVAPPTVPWLVDGQTDELGPPVLTQAWTTSFGEGFNQLDALRIASDGDGLRLGLDGVVQRDHNAVLVWIDLDPGAGTGAPLDPLTDAFGELDVAITQVELEVTAPGIGFDMVSGNLGATELRLGRREDASGLRGVGLPWGRPDNFFWLEAVHNFDDGNVALWEEPAPDAAAKGTTVHGVEMMLPWEELYPDGLPAGGAELALAVILVNDDGSYTSNQAFPPYLTADTPGPNPAPIERVVWVELDGTGALVGVPAVWP
jgi:hypothetical protein